MDELMEIFYSCACKILVKDILEKNGEYFSRTRYMENELKQLNAVLDKNTASRVDDLLCEQAAIDELREYASFQAGFRVALALTR